MQRLLVQPLKPNPKLIAITDYKFNHRCLEVCKSQTRRQLLMSFRLSDMSKVLTYLNKSMKPVGRRKYFMEIFSNRGRQCAHTCHETEGAGACDSFH